MASPPRRLGALGLLAALGAALLPCARARPLFGGGDLEQPEVWRALLAWAVEREVVLLTTNEHGLTDAVHTTLQLRALGVEFTLVHGTSPAVCAQFYAVVPDGACATTSWKPAHVSGTWHPRNFRSAMFTARKYIVYRLAVDEGLGVLQTDTDTVWLANPFTFFSAEPLLKYDVIVQKDVPFANAGVLYVRRARNGTAAGWIVHELFRTLQAFTAAPAHVLAAVREIVPSASRVVHKVENEQMALNDIIASAALGTRQWGASVKRLYAKSNSGQTAADRAAMAGEYNKELAALQAKWKPVAFDLSAVRASPPVFGPSNGCDGTRMFSRLGREIQIRPLGTDRAARPGWLLIAPPNLFAHLPSYNQLVNVCQAPSCALRAGARAHRAGAGAPAGGAPRPPVVAVMVHLAAMSSVKHLRPVVMQTIGSWDVRADGAAGALGHARISARTLALTLANFDLSALHTARNGSFVEGALVGPLVHLATLAGRRPAVPPLPCYAQPRFIKADNRRIVLPGSACKTERVPGDSSRLPSPAGQCPYLGAAGCHEVVLSRFELERLRTMLAARPGPRPAETRVRLRDVIMEQAAERRTRGAALAPLRVQPLGLAERVVARLGAAQQRASIVVLDGEGAPLSILADVHNNLPHPRRPTRPGLPVSSAAVLCARAHGLINSAVDAATPARAAL